jgi:D-aminoacyl-tRNA deacylase
LRVVLQRVARAAVRVDGETTGAIERGALLLVAVASGDEGAAASRMAQKCAELRIFPDAEGRFDRSLVDIKGEVLVVSQFTLLADTRRGRRPSFSDAAPPEVAAPIVDAFVQSLRGHGLRVAEGRFGAKMEVELVNDGPVTIVLDSADLDRPRRG